jgi:hypothetical protein
MENLLAEIKKYRNEAVIHRFHVEYPHLKDKADEIFEDLMVFFWATKKHEIELNKSPANKELDFVFIMDQKMKDIDNMWHIFLLFTKDYHHFCTTYFKEFIHHVPGVAQALPKDESFYETNLERFLNFNLDHLEQERIMRWFGVENEVI